MSSDDAKEIAGLLTTPEVAKELRVSHRTVLRLIDRGDLKAIRVGKLFRVEQTELAAYLRRGETTGEAK